MRRRSISGKDLRKGGQVRAGFPYTFRIGPGYRNNKESVVSNMIALNSRLRHKKAIKRIFVKRRQAL